jgi:hypothetical protein
VPGYERLDQVFAWLWESDLGHRAFSAVGTTH